MGKLAASIAHEVNNPMSFMLANLHEAVKVTHRLMEILPGLRRLRDAALELPESGDPRVERVREEAGRLAGGESIGPLLDELDDLDELIVDSLEGAERIRGVSDDMRRFAHGLPGVFDWADVNAIVETALHVVDAENRTDVRFDRRLDTLPEVRCQRHQIAQILLNLLQNAMEAVGGAGHVEVRTRSAESWVEIEVSDDGPGLAPENRERIFEAFYTSKDQGTGLGLAISRDIAQSHGGTLDAIGCATGACFLLRLPVTGP
jgi:signal transduction histidine kinase